MKVIETLKNIVGQIISKERVTEAVNSVMNDGIMQSFLIRGAAGLGKTAMMRAYYYALQAIGVDCLWFNSPEEFRAKGEAFSSVITLIMESEKWAIFIDEGHLLNHKSTVQMDTIRAFCFKFMDKNNDGQTIRLGEDMTVLVNRKKGCVCLATNFPHKLDKSGALQSRSAGLELDYYTHGELVSIVNIMLPKFGLQPASEKTLATIANCGRGTARPMEKIVEQLAISNSAHGGTKKTVNRDEIIHALKLSKMFPRGINPWEIRLLVKCQTNAMRDRDILTLCPGLEKSELQAAKSYLIYECGFAAEARGGIQTTTKGIRYLSEIVKDGFDIGGKVEKVGKAAKEEITTK